MSDVTRTRRRTALPASAAEAERERIDLILDLRRIDAQMERVAGVQAPTIVAWRERAKAARSAKADRLRRLDELLQLLRGRSPEPHKPDESIRDLRARESLVLELPGGKLVTLTVRRVDSVVNARAIIQVDAPEDVPVKRAELLPAEAAPPAA